MRPAREEILTICPLPCACISGSPAAVTYIKPSRLMLTISRHSSVLAPSIGPSRATPASLTRISTWGRVDILVNDAGVARLGPIEGAKTEEWREMVNINLLGLMYVTAAGLP